MGNVQHGEKAIDNSSLNLKKRQKPAETRLSTKRLNIFPRTKCLLRLHKLNRLIDYLTFEDNLHSLTYKKPVDTSFIDEIRGSPLQLGVLEEFVTDTHCIVSTGLGPEYYVPIRSFVDKTMLELNSTILLNNKDYSLVGILEQETDVNLNLMKLEKAPTITYNDIGGLQNQILEIKESVELPLTNPEYFEEMGIKPPRGVILYGPPGTGKTLLAKAVANKTSATFLRIVGSELIQKYLGDGPKLVRELFKAADNNAPAIIFIDEIDAIGKKRVDVSSSGAKEVQRTMLELLNQLDGFDARADIKVIMATNRIDSLDPALIRPGRIDRKIEFTMPDSATKLRIFDIHTSKMSLSKCVDLKKLVVMQDDLSGADIKAICSEAGMIALRERRRDVLMKDFEKAKEKVMQSKRGNLPEGLYL